MLKPNAFRLALLGSALIFGVSTAPSLRAQATSGSHPVRAGEQTTPVANAPDKRDKVEDESEQYRHSATVKKLGSLLGMSPEAAATTFTLLNLFVLFGAIGYALAKMLPKAFRARSTAIQKHLVDARTATEEASARLNSVEARLGKLDEQIAGMRTQAEADAAREEQRLKASAEDEKAKMLAAAEAEILSATTQARREIQRFAAELAIEQAARKLVVTAETDRLLVESFAHRLGAEKGSGN